METGNGVYRSLFLRAADCLPYRRAGACSRRSFIRKNTPMALAGHRGVWHIYCAYFLLFIRAAAAVTKPRNSGCGRLGRLLNSGWNWPATNQG